MSFERLEQGKRRANAYCGPRQRQSDTPHEFPWSRAEHARGLGE
jgi:hypothetical protein